jgi:hypothetical protein
VHKFTPKNHPDALKEGRIFVCKTDVVVCSRVYGMGLAYSLNEAHVGDHCKRVGGQPGMRMTLPFTLLPPSKDSELRSITPRPIPDFGLDPSATGEDQAGSGDRYGDGFGGTDSEDRDEGGSEKTVEEGSGSEGALTPKGLRLAPKDAGGVGDSVDHGGGPAAARRAKQRSRDRRRPKKRPSGGGGV